jgi:hypothetical protein
MSKLTWFNRIAKLTLGLSLLASVNVMAQKDDDDDEPTVTSSQGYVVTNKGDTLKGEIIERDKKTGLRFEGDKIKLIISPTEKKSYSPGKIKMYYNGENVFESVEYKSEEFAFMQVVDKGELTLYQLDLERDKKGEIEVYETQYYVKKTTEKAAIRIKENNFKKDIGALVKDNEDMLDEVNNKDLVFEDLEKVIKDYNAWALKKGAESSIADKVVELSAFNGDILVGFND